MNPGRELKEQGQLLALTNAGQEWTEQALSLLAAFLRDEAGDVFRWEEFRAYALFHGLPHPPSHNAWGPLATTACKRGMIVWTGEFDTARSARTHAHPVRLWRRAA